MENLLNEDDFLQKPYNPWNYFRWFYVGSVIGLAAFFGIRKLYATPDTTVIIVMMSLIFALPLMLAFVMMWWRKENFLLPPSTIIVALLILNVIFVACLSIMGLITALTNDVIYTLETFLQAIGSIVLVYVIVFLISIAIILPIAARKKRRSKIFV